MKSLVSQLSVEQLFPRALFRNSPNPDSFIAVDDYKESRIFSPEKDSATMLTKNPLAVLSLLYKADEKPDDMGDEDEDVYAFYFNIGNEECEPQLKRMIAVKSSLREFIEHCSGTAGSSFANASDDEAAILSLLLFLGFYTK